MSCCLANLSNRLIQDPLVSIVWLIWCHDPYTDIQANETQLRNPFLNVESTTSLTSSWLSFGDRLFLFRGFCLCFCLTLGFSHLQPLETGRHLSFPKVASNQSLWVVPPPCVFFFTFLVRDVPGLPGVMVSFLILLGVMVGKIRFLVWELGILDVPGLAGVMGSFLIFLAVTGSFLIWGKMAWVLIFIDLASSFDNLPCNLSLRSRSSITDSLTTGSFKAAGVVSSSTNRCASVARCAALSNRLLSVIFPF